MSEGLRTMRPPLSLVEELKVKFYDSVLDNLSGLLKILDWESFTEEEN